jgi:anti-sigma B factor antagonist
MDIAAHNVGHRVSDTGPVTVVKPDGQRLDIEVAGEFRQVLHDLVKAGRQNLVIDMSNVTFLDSSGMGALISALKMVKTTRDRRREPRPGPSRRPAVRGDVRLAAVTAGVVSLLQVIRLDRVFGMFPSVDEAVQSFEGTVQR